MELKKDLKLKYLTDTYPFVDTEENDIDNLYLLIREIKSKRKSKKNWSSSDFIFNSELAQGVFLDKTDDILESLTKSEYISMSESNAYFITNCGLNVFFNLK